MKYMEPCKVPENDALPLTASVALSRGLITLVGMSVYDPSTHVIESYEFSDTISFRTLNNQISAKGISVVLLPQGQDLIKQCIHLSNGDVEVIETSRHAYDSDRGMFYFNQINKSSGVLRLEWDENYFLLSSVSAIVDYLINAKCAVLERDFLRVSIINLENRMFITPKTAKELELVESSSKGGRSLFNVIKNTKTKMGTKLLRRNILEPLCNLEEINSRYRFIRFLRENADVEDVLGRSLPNFNDLDSVVSRMCKVVSQISVDPITVILTSVGLLSIAKSIGSLIDSFNEKKKFMKEPILMSFYDALLDVDYQLVRDNLNAIIDDGSSNVDTDALIPIAYLNAVKPGISELLDLSKRIYSENYGDLISLCSEQFGGEASIHFDTSRGYMLKTRNTKIVKTLKFGRSYAKRRGKNIYGSKGIRKSGRDSEIDLDSLGNLIFYYNRSGVAYFTTPEIQKIDSRLKEALSNIIEVSASICTAHIQEIQKECKHLWAVSEKIGFIDMLYSFYLFSEEYTTAIPVFGDTFMFTDSKNLLLRDTFTKSNCFYACDLLNFNIVMGGNMGGKSTYLKQAAHNVILSQIGCPVNCRYASTRIFKSILTRLSNEDDVGKKLSTFGVELLDSKIIMEYASKDSLVLIDELGRGTSYNEGLAFAITLAEFLISRKSYVYFVTHFRDIVSYIGYHQTVNVLESRNFSITSGMSNEVNGIRLAASILPKLYVDDASSYFSVLNNRFGMGDVDIFNNTYTRIALKLRDCRTDEEKSKLKEEILSSIK